MNGHIDARHVAALIPWVDGIEVINGSRLFEQNRTAMLLARRHAKVLVAGSDSHTLRGIGHTWIDAPQATTRAEFMADLHAGRVRTGGRHGNLFTMSSDVLRMTAGIYLQHGRAFFAKPRGAREQLFALWLLVGWSLVPVSVLLAALHFLLEARFNRSLLRDMAHQPGLGLAEWA